MHTASVFAVSVSVPDPSTFDCGRKMDKVRDAGGLYVIGTERHESRRIDNQLRGRSG